MGSHKTYTKCTKLYDLKNTKKKNIYEMSKRELKRKSKREEQKCVKSVSIKEPIKDKNELLSIESFHELMFIIIIILVMISISFGG